MLCEASVTEDRRVTGLTTCGHVKTFSPLIVSTDGSSNAHCFAKGSKGDTEVNKSNQATRPNNLITTNKKATKGT